MRRARPPAISSSCLLPGLDRSAHGAEHRVRPRIGEIIPARVVLLASRAQLRHQVAPLVLELALGDVDARLAARAADFRAVERVAAALGFLVHGPEPHVVGSTSCVCVTTAQSLPSALRIFVSHTIVVRPRCSATDSPVTVVLTFAPAMNFVLESVVVVRVAGGRLRIVPIAPSVSANAMYAPPWRMPPLVHSSGRTSIDPTTRSGAASSSRIPISPGKSGSI